MDQFEQVHATRIRAATAAHRCHMSYVACPLSLTAGALLLQVPEPVLMTTTSAARDSAFAKGMKAHAVSLSPEQASVTL